MFVGLTANGKYIFGRVVKTDAYVLGPGRYVIYVFRHRSAEKTMPPREALQTSELLLPPMITSKVCWTRGIFETIGHSDFQAGEQLPVHCFLNRLQQRYFDE